MMLVRFSYKEIMICFRNFYYHLCAVHTLHVQQKIGYIYLL